MSDKYIKVEEMTDHPMEELFGIEPSTTIVETTQRNTEIAVVEHPTYDDKDKEIEQQFEEVYDAAMETFHETIEQLDDIEPKYKNKSREVAVQFLNAALAAADKKAVMKANKDKLEKVTSKNNYTQNNLIFDRNELLKSLKTGRVLESPPQDDTE